MDDDNQYTHRADQHNQITIWFYNKFYSIENPNVSSFASDIYIFTYFIWN